MLIRSLARLINGANYHTVGRDVTSCYLCVSGFSRDAKESLFGDFRQRSPKEKSQKNNTEMDFLNLSGFHNAAVGVWINNSLCFAAHSTVNRLKLWVPRTITRSENTYVAVVPNISPIRRLSRWRGGEAQAVLLPDKSA